MSTHTALISRDLAKSGSGNSGGPVARVIELCTGDRNLEYDALPMMQDIYHWLPVELTDPQRDTILAALSAPHDDGATPPVETQAQQNVDLDNFSAGELTTLGIRGVIASGLGGPITNANFIITPA